MAVKASASITLSVMKDIASTTRYYLLQSSTLSKPSVPTAKPPGGSWDDTEPGYTVGSTNSLYTVDLTVFSDGTYEYSTVSLSSSYEAAKAAYNQAVSAKSVAQNAQTAVDSLEIGGRNFLLGSAALDITKGDITAYGYSGTSLVANKYGALSAIQASQAWNSFYFNVKNVLDRSGAKLGDTMTMSMMCMTTFTPSKAMPFHLYHIGLDGSAPGVSFAQGTITANAWFKVSVTFTVTQAVLDNTRTDSYLGTDYYYKTNPYTFDDDGYLYYAAPKIEFGNKATDWTPAPEDVDGDITEAQSTADTAKSLAETATTKLQYIVIRSDGTHFKAMETNNEMVLTNEGLHIDVGGEQYSHFGATFAQFGNYQIRRTSDGGLAFKLKL